MPIFHAHLIMYSDSWVKRDQLDATYFIITLFSAQHVNGRLQSNSNLHSAHTLNVAPQYRNLPHPTLPANTLHMQ